jgi:hypothetical protein
MTKFPAPLNRDHGIDATMIGDTYIYLLTNNLNVDESFVCCCLILKALHQLKPSQTEQPYTIATASTRNSKFFVPLGFPDQAWRTMIQTGLIQSAHNDLVTDVAYDFYGLRLATCSLDQRYVAPLLHIRVSTN